MGVLRSRQALLAILWPPRAAALGAEVEAFWWKLACAFLVIPLTAIWHHAVFYSPRCMLNDFGPDYTPTVVANWLSRDPSLAWAVVSAIAVYAGGKRRRWARLLAAPVFLAFLPLSLWIWDIPFTGRIVCRHWHDKRPLIPSWDLVIRTRYLYLLGALAYVALLLLILNQMWAARRPKTVRGADV